jgi:hypothetical protein
VFGLVTACYLVMQLIEFFEMDTDAPEPCYEVYISPNYYEKLDLFLKFKITNFESTKFKITKIKITKFKITKFETTKLKITNFEITKFKITKFKICLWDKVLSNRVGNFFELIFKDLD